MSVNLRTMWWIYAPLLASLVGHCKGVGYLTDYRHKEFGIGAELQFAEPGSQVKKHGPEESDFKIYDRRHHGRFSPPSSAAAVSASSAGSASASAAASASAGVAAGSSAASAGSAASSSAAAASVGSSVSGREDRRYVVQKPTPRYIPREYQKQSQERHRDSAVYQSGINSNEYVQPTKPQPSHRTRWSPHAPIYQEPTDTSRRIQPTRRPVHVEPTHPPIYRQKTRPTYVQPTHPPVYVQPRRPVYVQPTHGPIYVEPTRRPVYVQPTHRPLYVQPRRPVYLQPTHRPIYVQPTRRPVYVQPTHRPIYVQPTRRPVYVQPTHRPIYVQPTRRPVHVEPTRAPIYVQPTRPSPGQSCSSSTLCFCCRWTTRYTWTTKTCTNGQTGSFPQQICVSIRNGACVKVDFIQRNSPSVNHPGQCISTHTERQCTSCCPTRYGYGMPRCTTSSPSMPSYQLPSPRQAATHQGQLSPSNQNYQTAGQISRGVAASASAYASVSNQPGFRQRDSYVSQSKGQRVNPYRQSTRVSSQETDCCSTTRASYCCAISYQYQPMPQQRSSYNSIRHYTSQNIAQYPAQQRSYDTTAGVQAGQTSCCFTTRQQHCCNSQQTSLSQTRDVAPLSSSRSHDCCSSSMQLECCASSRVALGIPVSQSKTMCCGSSQPLVSCCSSLRLADCCDSSRIGLCCRVTNNAGKCCSGGNNWRKK